MFRRITEERIEQAMRDGTFDNLPGKGKPLKLDEDPGGDPAWRLAHHLLHSQGFTLPWIEMRREILADIERLRRDQTAFAAAEKRSAGLEARFAERTMALKRRILVYNLHAPSPALHLIDPFNSAAEPPGESAGD
jgi:DnaJ family protein C protein 28